jgi:hypothetical protein
MVLYVPKSRGSGWDSSNNDWDISVTATAPANLTAVTTGVSGANGSTVALISTPLPWVGGYVILQWGNSGSNALDTRQMFDIMIDRSGGTSWESTPFISNIICGWRNGVNNQSARVDFPLSVPAGATFAARSRTIGSVARSTRIGMTVIARDALPPGYPVGQKVVAVGLRSPLSELTGTLVTSGSGWVNVGSTLESDLFGLTLMFGGVDGSSFTGGAFTAQIGAGSQPLWQPQLTEVHTSFEVSTPMYSSINAGMMVPAGTQMQVRQSSTGGETFSFAIYGVQ